MNADEQTTAEVTEIMNQLGEAFRKRDMDRLVALLAPDPDVTFFGTGADEVRVGLAAIKEQIQRDWAQSDSVAMEWGRLSVSAQGTVAWVAGDVGLHAEAHGKDMRFPGRITAVMDKRDGGWRIDQWHLSVPMAGQETGQSFPT